MGRGRYAGVRIRSDNKSIFIDFYYNNVRCRETLKLEPTARNLKFASLRRAAILLAIEKGTFNYAEEFPTSKRAAIFCGVQHRPTVSQAMTDYLTGKEKSIAAGTMRGYISGVNYYIRPQWGDTFIDDLTVAGLRAWIGTLTCSNKRINNVLVPLRGMLKDAFADGLIDSDPMARIKNLPLSTPEPDPFSSQERDLILDAMHPAAALMFSFAFWTGLRTGELIAMEWGDVDMVNNIVRIRRSTSEKITKRTKTTAGMRDIELLEPAVTALMAMKPLTFLACAQVWQNPKTNKPWIRDSQIRQTCWMHALKKAGVRYRCPYQTRHTFASTLLSNGANPMWVANQMGHADWGMIRKRYGRWITQETSEAERMNKALFNSKTNTFGQDLGTGI